MATEACEVSEPKNLKELLQFIWWISHNNLTDNVCDKIEDMLKVCYSSLQVSEDSCKENLKVMFKTIGELRKLILNSPNNYGKYSSLEPSCGNRSLKCANILVKFLPKLHSEMWYLYFQTSTEMLPYRSSGQRGKGYVRRTNEFDIKGWLKSGASEYHSMPKGFSEGDLKNLPRDTLQLAANSGINFYGGGPLNHTQLGLFLLSEDKFQDSNLASAVLFVGEFCKEFSSGSGAFAGKLEDKVESCKLKDVCKEVADNLKPLTHTIFYALHGPKFDEEEEEDDDDDEEEEEVEEAEESPSPSVNMYQGKVKAEHFDDYKTWITKNLQHVITSLEKLSSECSKWNKTDLSNGTIAGPFKYGFVFKEENWENGVKSKLPGAISKLTQGTHNGSLKQLLQCFKSDVKLPSKAEAQARVPEAQATTQNPSRSRSDSTEKSVKVESQVTSNHSGAGIIAQGAEQGQPSRPVEPLGGTEYHHTVASTGESPNTQSSLVSTYNGHMIQVQILSSSSQEGFCMKLWTVLLLLFILKIF